MHRRVVFAEQGGEGGGKFSFASNLCVLLIFRRAEFDQHLLRGERKQLKVLSVESRCIDLSYAILRKICMIKYWYSSMEFKIYIYPASIFCNNKASNIFILKYLAYKI